MTAFELWTDGLLVVDRMARLFNKRTIARDPLSGVVDSVNTLFYANYYPIMSSGSLGVYVNSNTPISTGSYTLDYDAGCFTFTSAPAYQPSASYTFAKYSETTIRSVMVAGFDEMESRWFRGLSLSNTLGAGVVPITESSTHAYVVDSSGSDPQIGAITFSQSRAQINFYAKCVQLAFYLTLAGEHALTDFVWREAQGVYVDKSKTVPNLLKVIDALEKDLAAALIAAQFEWSGEGVFGGTITPPATREFVAHRYWQKPSMEQDWRGTTPYYGQVW